MVGPRFVFRSARTAAADAQCAACAAAGLSGLRYVALWMLYAVTFATIASTMIAAAKPQPSLFGSYGSLLLDISSLR